eukprot:UN27571
MFTCINQQGSKMSEQSATSKVEKEAKPTAKNTSNTTKSESTKVNNQTQNIPQKVSKVGSVALVISLLVASGVGYEFYQKLNAGKVQNLAVNALTEQNKILQQELQTLKSEQLSLQQALLNSEEQIAMALNENSVKNQQVLKAALQKVRQSGNTLNPQEVTSLQRMAEFKLWAEQDYLGTSAVLKRLDSLLSDHPGT